MRDQCTIGKEGHVKLFLKEFFLEIEVSVESKNVWILGILKKVWDF